MSEPKFVTWYDVPLVVAHMIKRPLEAQAEQIGRQQAHNAMHSAEHSESERQGHAQEQTGEEHYD
jgi:hypothetical protein